MGLDMYLHAKQYMSEYLDPEDAERIKTINEMFGIEVEDGDDHWGAKEVTFQVAYWRKANAIHKWFVDNCQNGEDNCQEAYVSTEDLEKLLSICKEILKDPSKAPDLLPAQSGFFFGSTDYDEYYVDDLKYTVERIEKILGDPTICNMEIYYHSSW